MASRPLRSRRLPTAILLGLTLVVAMLLGALGLARTLAQISSETATNLEYGRTLNLALATLRDSETGQRGFLLTDGDPRFLAPYTRAAPRVLPSFDEMAEVELPRARTLSARLRPLAVAKMAELGTTIDLVRAGRMPAALTMLREGRGSRLMDRMRPALENERVWVRETNRSLALRGERRARQLAIGLAVGLAALVAIAFLFIRDARNQLFEVTAARREAEMALAALGEQVEARAEAEEQLRQMQKMESLGQLTGGIAHDFNNMLAVVMGGLELARRRLQSDPVRADRSLEQAQEGAKRAASLTARLLAFARRQPLAPLALDANALVGGMNELLARTLGDHIEVELVRGAGLWRCFADRGELENAILNLAVNARDAMPKGGKLTVETANSHIDDAYARTHPDLQPGQFVTICVTDTGTGMPPEVREKAFEPFFTTKEVGRGTGLGLSQVFGFAKQSGGHVAIYSEEGQGTTVKLYLPRFVGVESAGGLASISDDIPQGAGETILVVEDEARVREFAVEALSELGYATVVAPGPAEALALLETRRDFALLFTDIVMPGMNGRELAQRAAELQPGLKVLFTTGYTPNAVVHNGMLDAGVAFLAKPYAIAELARKVRATLDGEGVNRPA